MVSLPACSPFHPAFAAPGNARLEPLGASPGDPSADGVLLQSDLGQRQELCKAERRADHKGEPLRRTYLFKILYCNITVL